MAEAGRPGDALAMPPLPAAEADGPAARAGGLHILCDVRNTAGLALFASADYQEVCRATLWGDHFSVREKRLTLA